jgi:hypothetical protein
MKNILILALLISGVVFNSGCSHTLAPAGHFQDQAVVIDGNMGDWTLPLRFSNPEYSMQYSVTNDDKNIFICVYSKNEAFQKRMLKNGMTIYFDAKGEKNKNCALNYPIKKTPQPDASGNQIRYSDYRATMDQLLLHSDYYNAVGFVNMENGQYDIKATQTNIKVALKLGTDSSLVYEAAIPIKYVLGKDLTAGTDSKNFSVGITLNAMMAQSRNEGYPSHSYHGGNSMGGMHGMGGGRHYGQNANASQKAEENWYTFRFAYKKSV